MKIHDYTDRQVGHALVLGPAPSDPRFHSRMWRIRCGCGTEYVQQASFIARAIAKPAALLCPPCAKRYVSLRAKVYTHKVATIRAKRRTATRRCRADSI